MPTSQDEIEKAELLLAKARSTTEGEASALVYKAYRCLAKAVAAYDETETEQNPGYRHRERRLARDRRTTDTSTRRTARQPVTEVTAQQIDAPVPEGGATTESKAPRPVAERDTTVGAGPCPGDYRFRAADRVTRNRAGNRNRTAGENRAARDHRAAGQAPGRGDQRVTAARDAETARLARFYYLESQADRRGEHVIDLRA